MLDVLDAGLRCATQPLDDAAYRFLLAQFDLRRPISVSTLVWRDPHVKALGIYNVTVDAVP